MERWWQNACLFSTFPFYFLSITYLLQVHRWKVAALAMEIGGGVSSQLLLYV